MSNSNKFGLHLALNSLSFGNVSILLLKTLWEREKNGENIDWFLSPIGNIDFSAEKENKELKRKNML